MSDLLPVTWKLWVQSKPKYPSERCLILFTPRPTTGWKKKQLYHKSYQIKWKCKTCAAGGLFEDNRRLSAAPCFTFYFQKASTSLVWRSTIRFDSTLSCKSLIAVLARRSPILMAVITRHMLAPPPLSPPPPHHHHHHTTTPIAVANPWSCVCLSPSAHISMHVPKQSRAAGERGVQDQARYTDHMCQQTTKRWSHYSAHSSEIESRSQ